MTQQDASSTIYKRSVELGIVCTDGLWTGIFVVKPVPKSQEIILVKIQIILVGLNSNKPRLVLFFYFIRSIFEVLSNVRDLLCLFVIRRH